MHLVAVKDKKKKRYTPVALFEQEYKAWLFMDRMVGIHFGLLSRYKVVRKDMSEKVEPVYAGLGMIARMERYGTDDEEWNRGSGRLAMLKVGGGGNLPDILSSDFARYVYGDLVWYPEPSGADR